MKFAIQKKTGLAVGSLQALHDAGKTVQSPELAAAIDTTTSFLPQIMAPLVKKGWVDSKRGPNGGYRLAADPESISVLDLIEAVEGDTDTMTCVLKGGPCGGLEHCSFHEPWKAARTALLNELASVPVLTLTQPHVEITR
jgi:Rrf2 family iron-sulfur cluster assembly transcriptional regulator